MLSEREVLSILNGYVDSEPFDEIVHIGGNSYRCFVEDGFLREDVLYGVHSFDANGASFEVLYTGFTASDSILRYFDIRVDSNN